MKSYVLLNTESKRTAAAWSEVYKPLFMCRNIFEKGLLPLAVYPG